MRIAIVVAAALAAAGIAGIAATEAAAQGAGDPKAGATIFNKCKACHALGPGAANKIGPELNGIIGEQPGAVEGYQFSKPFMDWAASQGPWTAETMRPWLENPRAVVKGTKMAFPGLKNPAEIDNLIAHLLTFDEAGNPTAPAN
ncbi:c-type cytochrome [Antarcticirhabdus aurantiaca]|uniref:C-type cytochrome n=1 Tax=Antarcticirhabdus aurantiaca TaxID=2606717 RepID=A0ACD4NID3_9HYPH|nr:c-type cytochrome [Antarcticirhabdus aurantiaca]WAJ26585.1 c-type cytochrome [Jeongeuplla avenae]